MIVLECFFRIRHASMGTAFAGRKTATVEVTKTVTIFPHKKGDAYEANESR